MSVAVSLSAEQSERLREQIAECLGVEIDEVVPGARFFSDLGGESIDVLDLAFRVEKAFGVRPQFTLLKENASFAVDGAGQLSAASLAEIRAQHPDLPIPAAGPVAPRDLFTVGMIEALVGRALSVETRVAPASGNSP